MSSTRSADHIGRVLGERYRLMAAIGTGASAHVFLADDVRLRRRVAVKILHPALAGDESFLRRFRAEARAAAALNHPHVLAVYDWGEEQDGPYLVSEYLAGGSLRSMLDQGRRLTPAQALLVGLEAARGLDYAHRRGLVHRDIKPANLLFDDDGRLRIADFGLARALAEAAWTEPAGAVLGTARYASPEQARGQALDGRADVYSLAIVLIESVTGAAPFSADTTVGTLMARLEKSLEAPPALGPLVEVVARAGRLQPDERLDAAELAVALGAVAPELARPGPLPLAGVSELGGAVASDLVDPTELGPQAASGRSGFGPATASDAAPANRRGRRGPPVSDTEADTQALAMARTDSTPIGAAESNGATSFGPAGSARAFAEEDPDATMAVGRRSRPPRRRPPDGGASRPAQGPGSAGQESLLLPAGARRRRRRTWLWVPLFLLLMAAGAVAASLALRIPTHPVPDLVGASLGDVRVALLRLNLEISEERTFDDEVAVDVVISQSPAAGAVLEEGSRVAVRVSDGPPPVPVPDLEGLTEAEATARLGEVGLALGQVTRRTDEEVAAGRVLDWSPRDASPPKGSAVDLAVSAGPEKRMIPEGLLGRIFEEVDKALDGLGLVAVPTNVFTDDEEAKGQVISVNPGPGERVDRGSRVAVAVAAGRPSVPETTGLSVEAAGDKFEGAGLELGQTYGPRGGKVFTSVPPAGAKIRPGSKIDVYVR
ncbi:MAG: protein kinase domain-containing protein [Acidimicrobiales bacterium]